MWYILSLAKQFEKNIAMQLKDIKDAYVYRLSDLVNKFGVSNPCDYFCFYKNTFFLFEMKTTETASMPLKNISDYQYESMLEASNKKGIKAYFIIWWYSKDVTRAIPVSVIKDIKVISILLGHSNWKITQDTYVHASLDNIRKSINELGKLCR